MKERGGGKLMSRRYSLGKNVSLGGGFNVPKNATMSGSVVVIRSCFSMLQFIKVK